MTNSKESILELAKTKGILRSRDLLDRKLSRVTLARLVKEGRMTLLSRGLYALPDRDSSEQSTLAEIIIKHPQSIFCLLTALQIHGVGTQAPHQVWIAIDVKARRPTDKYLPLKVVRFSEDSLSSGVETMTVDGVVQAQVTCLEKTIADCFKFRNKIGIDIAIEALQDAWRNKRISMDELWKFAKICRVANVMKPYLESLND